MSDRKPNYSTDDKKYILAAAVCIEEARVNLLRAAELIQTIAYRDLEYDGYGLEAYKQVMWLTGEDAAGAREARRGAGGYMKDIVELLKKEGQ